MFRVIHDGAPVVAVFQEATAYGCAIRVAFDGTTPAMPAVRDTDGAADESGFFPDEIYPDE